jgi:oligosaccharide repeat unit polymerase
MSLLLVATISFFLAIYGKLLFKKWINHLTLYCIIMGGLVFLYELKLLPYPTLIPLTWFFIISAFLSFLLGILTIVSAKNLNYTNKTLEVSSEILLPIFADDGKTLRYAIFLFSLLCLLVGILNWVILIKMFGSIPAVFINENIIYSLANKGEIKEQIPYISIIGFGNVAIFFSGIYAAYKGKFSLLTLFPFLGIIIKELATAGRVGIMYGILEFLFAFFLFRHLLSGSSEKFKFSRKNAIIASIVLTVFIIGSASFIRITRGSFENFMGQSNKLKQLNSNMIITPSVYLYLSSDIGVLNQYLQSKGENTKFGQNTFLLAYDLLAKAGVVNRPNDYQKGYFIPMWTNTGTYIRELHADFGVTGVFLGPYLLGLVITWLWFKFYNEKSLKVFVFLVHLYLIVGFSFLVMITRLPYYFISLIFILFLIPILEKIARVNYYKSQFKGSGIDY